MMCIIIVRTCVVLVLSCFAYEESFLENSDFSAVRHMDTYASLGTVVRIHLGT